MILLSSYPLYSVSIHPCFIILSNPSCSSCDWQSCSSVSLMLSYHVLTPTSCCLIASSIILQYLLPLQPLVSKPLIFKPCISFDTRQSDYHILLCYLSSIAYTLNSLSLDSSPNSSVQPLSNSHPTPVSNSHPKIIGHTYILYEWVQHISWSQVLYVTLFWLPVNQLWSDSEPVPVLSWNQPLTGGLLMKIPWQHHFQQDH